MSDRPSTSHSDPDSDSVDTTLRHWLLRKVEQRGVEKTICPSEVAREVGGDAWRDWMERVRIVGTALADEGKIVVMQRGNVVDPRQARGPIRYRLRSPASPDAIDA